MSLWNWLKPSDLPIAGEVWEKKMIQKDYKWLQKQLDALDDPDPGDVNDAKCSLTKPLPMPVEKGQCLIFACPIHGTHEVCK